MGWFSRLRGGATAQVGPLTIEFAIEAQTKAVETVDNALDDYEELLVDLERARAELEAAGADDAELKAAFERAKAARAKYRDGVDSRPELMGRPYPEAIHKAALGLLPGAEYAASISAFYSAGIDGAELVLLPFGIVFGLVIAAHNLGILLKGLHVARAVRHMPADQQEQLPPAEFFGSSPAWGLATLLAGSGLVLGSVAAMLVRINLDIGVPAQAFLLVTFVVGVAAATESFLWANPWLETLDEHDLLVRRASAARASQAGWVGECRGEFRRYLFAGEMIQPRALAHLKAQREAAFVALERTTSLNPHHPDTQMHHERVRLIDEQIIRAVADIPILQAEDGDAP